VGKRPTIDTVLLAGIAICIWSIDRDRIEEDGIKKRLGGRSFDATAVFFDHTTYLLYWLDFFLN
jgi:hypothetical protein